MNIVQSVASSLVLQMTGYAVTLQLTGCPTALNGLSVLSCQIDRYLRRCIKEGGTGYLLLSILSLSIAALCDSLLNHSICCYAKYHFGSSVGCCCDRCAHKRLLVRVGTFKMQKGDPIQALGMTRPEDWDDWAPPALHEWFLPDHPISEFVIL